MTISYNFTKWIQRIITTPPQSAIRLSTLALAFRVADFRHQKSFAFVPQATECHSPPCSTLHYRFCWNVLHFHPEFVYLIHERIWWGLLRLIPHRRFVRDFLFQWVRSGFLLRVRAGFNQPPDYRLIHIPFSYAICINKWVPCNARSLVSLRFGTFPALMLPAY